jgi:hypothetical protein
VDDATHEAIGDLPRGRGVLGALIDNPQPLRLREVGQHPSSYGFPAGHPVMRSFLGGGNLLAEGTLDISPCERGTLVKTCLPARRRWQPCWR